MHKSLPHTPKVKRPAKRPSWLQRAFAGLFGKPAAEAPPAKAKPRTAASGRPIALNKAETALLPPFAGLSIDRIYVPKTQAECRAASQAIIAAGVAGFDTEARPTFTAGQKSTGPHVVQFALTDCAYIFQLHRPECQHIAAELIATDSVLKVGFGLTNDHGQIRRRLGVNINSVLDLDHIFRKRGYKGQIGVRGAIGAILGLSFPKSKSTTTSNWATPVLTPRQLTYAANDAYAALKIMEALNLSREEITTSHHHPERNPRRRR